MRPFYLPCCLLLAASLPLTVAAQADTTFFDSDWKPTTERAKAAFYHNPPEKSGKRYHFKDYYISHALQMDGWYLDDKQETEDGYFTYYYEDGTVKSQGKYVQGKEDSVWTYHWNNGKVQKTETYRKGQLHGPRMMYYKNGVLRRREVFDRDSVKEGHVFDRNGIELEFFPYQYIERMPEFRGDLVEWLSSHITYPPKAHNKNIEGKVMVQFVVNENGRITKVKIKKSSGNDDLDKEAIRVVKAMPEWRPGTMDDEPVKVYYNLPVTFKLD